MINIDCLEIEQKKKLYKILRENENDTERIIEEGKNYFGPWKSYDENKEFIIAFKKMFKVNEEICDDGFKMEYYFYRKYNETTEKKENTFLKRKTKRNENEIRIEVESKSKIPKIEHRNVIECQKNNIDFNNKEKSKTLIESNKNDIEIENAIKSKEQKNLNAEKIKEKKNENLLNRVKRQFFEFFVKAKNQYYEEKKKAHLNPKEIIKNFINLLSKYKWRDLLEVALNISFKEIYENKEENKEVISLLDKNGLQYIKEILSKNLPEENEINNNEIVKAILNFYELIKSMEHREFLESKRKKKKKTKPNNSNSKEFNIINNNINQDIFKNKDDIIQNSFVGPESNKNNIIFNKIIDNERSTTNENSEKKSKNKDDILKDNREDNLFNIVMTLLLSSFINEFNEINEKYELKKPKDIKNDYINQESKLAFLKSNFCSFVDKCQKILKEKKNQNSEKSENQKKVEELMNMTKLKYLEKIREDKGEKLFDEDKNEQIKKYQNLKCKNKILEFYQSKNIEGLFLMLNFVSINKERYIDISNEKIEEFIKIIHKCEGSEDFSIKLSDNENKDIENRIIKLNKIAQNPIEYLDDIKPRKKETN